MVCLNRFAPFTAQFVNRFLTVANITQPYGEIGADLALQGPYGIRASLVQHETESKRPEIRDPRQP